MESIFGRFDEAQDAFENGIDPAGVGGDWDNEEPEQDDETQDDPDDEGYQMTDVEADADTLASAGWGTHEDYGDYGDSGLDWDWDY